MVFPPRSELMGFCMGISSPVTSLIFARVPVRVVFILSHEADSLARSVTGAIMEIRGIFPSASSFAGAPGTAGAPPLKSMTQALSWPRLLPKSLAKASHKAAMSGRNLVSKSLAISL